MTPETYHWPPRRWRLVLARRPARRRRPPGPGAALLHFAAAATETADQTVLFAQAESSQGPLASGRYRR